MSKVCEAKKEMGKTYDADGSKDVGDLNGGEDQGAVERSEDDLYGEAGETVDASGRGGQDVLDAVDGGGEALDGRVLLGRELCVERKQMLSGGGLVMWTY